MKKKEIEQQLSFYMDTDSFSGNLDKIIAAIKDIPKRLRTENQIVKDNPKRFHRYEIKWEYDYSDSPQPRLYGFRWETDEEFKERKRKSELAKIASAASVKAKKKQKAEQERKDYERLKKKFEKK